MLLGWLLGAAALTAAEAPREYLCRHAGTPPVIDGRLDEPSWQAAAWSAPFVDIEGGARPAPRFATRFRALWDERHLYVAAELEEPDLWATLAERDAVIYREHDFELFLDPDGDGLHYYELEVNALGTIWDLMLDRPYHRGGRADNSWEITGLGVGVALDGTLNDPRDRDRGWTVELAIPWSAFGPPGGDRRPPRPDAAWRVNFSRVEWRLERREDGYRPLAGAREDNWVWSPQGVVDMHRPERWGRFVFVPDRPRE